MISECCELVKLCDVILIVAVRFFRNSEYQLRYIYKYIQSNGKTTFGLCQLEDPDDDWQNT